LFPPVGDSIAEKLPKNAIPDNFEKFELHSSFFINFWPYLCLLVVLGGIVIAVILLESVTKTWRTVNKICVAIRRVLKWNFCIIIFTTCYTAIMINTSLEVRTANPNEFLPIIS